LPFVPVPKDLNKVKTKVALNLTKRQLICFSLAAAVGVPTYIFTRSAIGNEGAVLLMMGVMLPFFFMAMYEKDDQPAEKILRNIIRSRFYFPRVRPYKTENFYAVIEREGKRIASEKQAARTAGKKPDRRRKKSKKRKGRT
jgi:hypothetical protein